MDGHGSHLTDQFLAGYVIGRVFVTLLPSHTSHVTQPLDVGCFAPLKQYFRSTLSDLGGQDFGAAITKQNFLTAYCYARKEAFTIRNIRAAWRASGLWPVNINQVLQNPFVEAAAAKTPLAPLLTMEYEAQGVATPKGGKELRNLTFRTRQAAAPFNRQQRGILQKAAKALDLQTAKIAQLERQKRALEQQIEDLQPKKKQKVVLTLGQRLVGIA